MEIKPNSVGKCPHCLEKLRFEPARLSLENPSGNVFGQVDSSAASCRIHGAREIVEAIAAACPSCGKPIVSIVAEGTGWRAYPLAQSRSIPEEVSSGDKEVAEDYREPSLLLNLIEI